MNYGFECSEQRLPRDHLNTQLYRIGLRESDLCVYHHSMWFSGLGAVSLIPGLCWITLNQSFQSSVSQGPLSTF